MNVERLNAIAEWLEAGAPHKNGVVGLDMSVFSRSTECGSVCCISGAADQFFGGEYGESLELNDGQWHALCAPYDPGVDEYNDETDEFRKGITLGNAARCIRKLIATGEVDWEGIRNP